MNKQIQKLIEQCTTYYHGGLGTEIEVFDKEKFAQLIVAECASVLLRWKGEPFPFDEDLAASLIKKHFEVE